MTDPRVEKGMAWLDENFPDWLDRIDPDRIDMLAPARCPLGQAAGTPNLAGWCVVTGSTELRNRRGVQPDTPRLTFQEATRLGFYATANENAALTAAWRNAIAATR